MFLGVPNQALSASTTTLLLSERDYMVGEGDLELSFYMSPRFFNIKGFDSNGFQFKFGGNYFVSDIFAPGLDLTFDSGGIKRFRFIPNLKAYIPLESRFLPFFKIGLGYTRWYEENFLAINLSPGVNYLISNTVAVGAQLNYEFGAGNGNYHLFEVPLQFALYFRY